MAIDPETNKIHPCGVPSSAMALKLAEMENVYSGIVQANGKPVPSHWTILKVDEKIVVSNYTFRVAYMNESCVVLEPVSPLDTLPEKP